MEKLKKYLLTVIVGFLVAYCLGSFYNASFNIREWEIGSRFAVTITVFMVSLFGLITSFGEFN